MDSRQEPTLLAFAPARCQGQQCSGCGRSDILPLVTAHENIGHPGAIDDRSLNMSLKLPNQRPKGTKKK